MHFIIINTHKDHPIIFEQISAEPQPWVYHVEPVGVSASCGVSFGSGVALFAELVGLYEVVVYAVTPCIRVDEVLVFVVRRVYVNHLDFFMVRELQKFEHFEVVTLYENILTIGYTLVFIHFQCGIALFAYGLVAVTLSCSGKTVMLMRFIDFISKNIFEFLRDDLPIFKNLRKYLLQFA